MHFCIFLADFYHRFLRCRCQRSYDAIIARHAVCVQKYNFFLTYANKSERMNNFRDFDSLVVETTLKSTSKLTSKRQRMRIEYRARKRRIRSILDFVVNFII